MNSFQASGAPSPPPLTTRLECADTAAAADDDDDNVDDELYWEGRGAGPAADNDT